MNKRVAVKELESLINEGETIILPTKWSPKNVVGASTYVNWELYAGWHTRSLSFFKNTFPDESDFIVLM